MRGLDMQRSKFRGQDASVLRTETKYSSYVYTHGGHLWRSFAHFNFNNDLTISMYRDITFPMKTKNERGKKKKNCKLMREIHMILGIWCRAASNSRLH